MTATTETFSPPTEDAGRTQRRRKWQWAFMIAGGIFILGTLALRFGPALLGNADAEVESGPTLAPALPATDNAPLSIAADTPAEPAAAPVQPQAQTHQAQAHTVPAAPIAPAAGTVPTAPPAAASDATALNTAPPPADTAANPVSGSEAAVPDTPAAPAPDLSDASGEQELPVSAKVADRVMEAVGIGSPAPAAAPAAAPATVLQARVAVGGGQHLNVRSTPGAVGTATVIGSLADGSEIEISAWTTAADGSVWVRLQDPEAPAIDQGWLFGPLVALADADASFTDLPEATP